MVNLSDKPVHNAVTRSSCEGFIQIKIFFFHEFLIESVISVPFGALISVWSGPQIEHNEISCFVPAKVLIRWLEATTTGFLFIVFYLFFFFFFFLLLFFFIFFFFYFFFFKTFLYIFFFSLFFLRFFFFSFCIYSRLSLSRIPRDSLKYFEISVVRHIRFAELRKK